MTLLAPWLLLAAGAAAVPILIHFLQRSRGRTVSFPAIRYLQRTAKDHARSIRARQKLLLLLRVLLLVLLVLAAARPLFTLLSSDHPPTAVALVVDNTASSGAVDGGVRVLDRLKSVARASLAQAREGDRFWLIRVGEPWIPARPLSAAEARRTIEEVDPAPTGAGLGPAVRRGMDLVRAAGMEGAEVHVLSDLQRSALDGLESERDPVEGAAGANPPVLVWIDTVAPPANVGVSSVLVDGGLAPLPGDRADFVFSLVGSGSPPGALSVRLFAEDRLRGRVDGELGAPGVIQAGPFSSGWIAGSVEVDPDALRADDRRFFAFRVRPPVPVSGLDAAGPFVEEGLRVLEESGRVRLVAVGGEVLVRSGGGAVRSRSGASSILVLPPTDATLLPGLNRFLEELGTGWRFGASLEPGRVPLQSRGIPGLEGVEVMAGYRLLASGANGGVLATTRNGEPWLVEGDGRGTRVLIASSPLHPGFTTLPVRAGMIPFLDWALTRWAAGSSPTSDVTAGDELAPPPGATAVITPDAVRLEADAFGALGHRGSPGIYRFLAGDSLLAVVAVNVPARESDLTRAGPGPVASLAGRDGAVVASLEEWEGAIFRARTGPEGGGLLLALALMLLLVESLVAASGQTSRGEGVRPPTRGRSRGEARS